MIIRARQLPVQVGSRLFLNAKDVDLPQNISTRVPKRWNLGILARRNKTGHIELRQCQRGKVDRNRHRSRQGIVFRECGFRWTTRLRMVAILFRTARVTALTARIASLTIALRADTRASRLALPH